MVRKRKKKKIVFGRLTSGMSRLGGLAMGPARSLVLGGLAVGLFVGAAAVTWHKVADRVLSSDDYIVRAEGLDITPQPPWIHADIAGQAFEFLRSTDRRLSIMDDDATERVAGAFSLHPWVKRVTSVSKHHPARVKIELEYRKPVCMVMVKTADGTDGLDPVDVEGVFLPTADFSSVEARAYPWLTGFHATAPAGGAGNHWGDERVVGAAEIAAAFADDWKKLKLDRIEPADPGRSAYRGVYSYTLFTHGGTKIIWGRPPGSELPSEAPAADKIARLKELAEVRGSLDGSRPRSPIDVRSRDGLRLLDQMAMEKPPDKPGRPSQNR